MTDALGGLGIRSRLFCRATCTAPWTFTVEPSELMHFHILERGSAWVDFDGATGPVALAPGDLLVIGPRQRYRIVDPPGHHDSPAIVFADAHMPGRPISLETGGKGAASVLVWGAFSLEQGHEHPLLEILPKVMHIRAGGTDPRTPLEGTVRSLIEEAAEMRPGAEGIISRLADILFVHVLREWLAQQNAQPGWLAAFSDRHIAPAMALIHSNPQQAWTVDELAGKVGLSRSRFTVRFGRVVGKPPRAYIARVRMMRAADMLKGGRMSVMAVALASGYESESSFNKAFKRFYSKPPGQFR
ncbi:MAG TPA: AraC family transcriptional regulator, partial [Steroidobacteraceae bacterium]